MAPTVAMKPVQRRRAKLATKIALLTILATVCLHVYAPRPPRWHQQAIHNAITGAHTGTAMGVRTSRCLVYDRPPRTGSTTVSTALQACLSERGWHAPSGQPENLRKNTVTVALEHDHNDYAVVKGHSLLSPGDLQRIKSRCGRNAFFITSTARMDERVWSAAKMSLQDGNGNSSLHASRIAGVHKYLLSTGARYADYLDMYPFTNVSGRAFLLDGGIRRVDVDLADDMRRHGFGWDYVIRKAHMATDLSKLLTVLGCPRAFDVMNVHSVQGDAGLDKVSADLLAAAVPGGLGNRHVDLLEVAEGNDRALDRLRTLMGLRDASASNLEPSAA